jgi:Caspase domain
LIAFATQPGASASDGTGGNSPYAKVLANEIRTPGLDLFNTFNEVARRVDEETGHKQTPWLSSSPITGRFFFVPPVPAEPGPPLAVVPPPAPPPEIRVGGATAFYSGASFSIQPGPGEPARLIARTLEAEFQRAGFVLDRNRPTIIYEIERKLAPSVVVLTDRTESSSQSRSGGQIQHW